MGGVGGRRAVAAWGACQLWFCLPLVSQAQAPTSAQGASAAPYSTAAAPSTSSSADCRSLYQRGSEAFEAGRLPEARALLKAAEEANCGRQHPVVAALAAVEFELENYLASIVKAREALKSEQALTTQQQQMLQQILEGSRPHVGRYRIHLNPAHATLTVNAKPAKLVDGILWLAPGKYLLRAEASGQQPQVLHLHVRPHSEDDLTFNLEPEATPAPVPMSTDQTAKPPVVAYVVGGVGGALIVGSLVPGLMARSTRSVIKQKCPTLKMCDPALKKEDDRAKRLAVITDVMWITGAAALGTGVALYLLGRDDETAPSTPAVEATVGLGPGSVAASATLRF